MTAIRSILLCGLGALVLASCANPFGPEATRESDDDRGAEELGAIPNHPNTQVCNGGLYHCYALMRTDVAYIQPAATPSGFGPSDLASAYKLNTSLGAGMTIAVVDAYNYPNAESDLAKYRAQYGLPACTQANGCLKIINQNGATSPLPANAPSGDDWTVEAALDLDLASAACPSCKILVVQADDDQGNGLDIAQNAAATLGAAVISNSWGGPEQAGQSLAAQEAYFNHPNIAVFVSAGDNGYNDAGQGPDYPATSSYTIAVGGTHLVKDASARGWTETAWTSGGSACSLSITKPAYQTNSGCTFKATTDIAAVGDPQTGVAVYNSRNGGWTVVGGTSASSPLVAAIFAATGNSKQTSGSFVKDNAAKLYDVTSGTNGTCTNAILCTAGVGWDGPTGYGTPNASLLVAGSGGGNGNGWGNGTGMGTGSGSNAGGNPDGGGASSGTSESSDDNAVTGGCNAGGSGSGFASLMLVGFAVARRRRR